MKKITLTQENFKFFFSPVGPLHGYHEEHFWPYDYVDRNSETLLVTIGDSWTWGSGICDRDRDAVSITEQENNFRLKHVYGNLISEQKNWNWLNLGFYQQGNQWIANKVFELRRLVPLLEFKKIIVMCVLTSTARWFHTWHDGLEDYKKHFEENQMLEHHEFEQFFVGLNSKIIGQIQHLTRSVPHVQLLVGTNAVDHCGFDALARTQIISSPWYKLLSNTDLEGISVDMESIRYLPGIENCLYNSDQKFAFQKWMRHKIDQAEKQHVMLTTMNHLSGDRFHPTHHGHQIWSDYILGEVL